MSTTTITREEVEAKIIDGVVELGPEREQVTREATLDALDIDSLDLIELAQIIEQDLGVWITAEDAEQMQILGDVFDLVWARAQQ
jgi:acyl carrier protein